MQANPKKMPQLGEEHEQATLRHICTFQGVANTLESAVGALILGHLLGVFSGTAYGDALPTAPMSDFTFTNRVQAGPRANSAANVTAKGFEFPGNDYCAHLDPDDKTNPVTNTGAWRVWNELGFYGQGVKIGISGTGASPQHEALTSSYAGSLPGGGFDHNYAWFDSLDRGPQPHDSFQIGTFLSGVAVGVHPDQCFGVAPQAKYVACKNTDGNGRETIQSYLICLDWMRAPYDLNRENPRPDLRPDVIYTPPCLSCGPQPFVLQDPIGALRAAGTVVVTSSGSITNGQNNCNKTNSPPASYPEVITVGGLRNSDDLALSEGAAGPSSLNGVLIPKPDLVAHADGVLSSVYAGGQNLYLIATGTEIAAAEVVGSVALMLSANPKLKGQPRLVADILYSTALTRTGSRCDSNGDLVPNNEFGYGQLDAYKAVKRAMEYPYGGCPKRPVKQCRMNGKSTAFSVTQDLLQEVDGQQRIRFRYRDENGLKGQFGLPHRIAGEAFRLCIYDTVDDVAVPTGVVLNSGFELKTAQDVAAGHWERIRLNPDGKTGLSRYRFRGPSVEGNDGIVLASLDEELGRIRFVGSGAALPLARVRSVKPYTRKGKFQRTMYEAANGVVVQAHSTASGACWGAYFDQSDITENTVTSFLAEKRMRR